MKPKGYYSDEELYALGVQFGKNVLVSNKTSLYGNKIQMGDNVRIDDFCILVGDIKIGSFVHIASYCQLSGSSGIIIEDFTGIASRTLIFSQTDDYTGAFMTGPLVSDKYKNVSTGTVILKKHSIVGAGSIIMPKVTLSEGTAIGAFSFVNKDTDAWSINVGTPSKKIKDRKKNILELEKQFQKENYV